MIKFGGVLLDEALYSSVIETIPEGVTIVELGSGKISNLLSEKYDLWSVEHDIKWVGVNNTKYIYAPLRPYSDAMYPTCTGWYDIEVLKEQLPKEYAAIIVDGPVGGSSDDSLCGRGGFDTYFDIFRSNVPIFFDDVQRDNENRVLRRVARKLGLRSHEVYHEGKKMWAVLRPDLKGV